MDLGATRAKYSYVTEHSRWEPWFVSQQLEISHVFGSVANLLNKYHIAGEFPTISYYLLSQSRYCPYFMQSEGALPSSHEPFTCPSLYSTKSSLVPATIFTYYPF